MIFTSSAISAIGQRGLSAYSQGYSLHSINPNHSLDIKHNQPLVLGSKNTANGTVSKGALRKARLNSFHHFDLDKLQRENRETLQRLLHEVHHKLRHTKIITKASFSASTNGNIPPLEVSTYYLQTGEVITDIVNRTTNSRLFAAIYDVVVGGWKERNSRDGRVIPSTTSPNEFNAALLSAYLSCQILFAKAYAGLAKPQSEPPNPAPIEPKRKGDPQPAPKRQAKPEGTRKGDPPPCPPDTVEQGFAIEHDLVCTTIGNTMRMSLICTVVVVDYGKCCLDHDIELWCGPSLVDFAGGLTAWLTKVNLKLSACIFGEIVAQGAKSDMPWYCGGAITATALSLLYASTWSLQVLVATEAATLAMWVANDDKIGDLHSHKDSCLCDGRTPTVAIDNPCRDMCKERNGGQGKQDCYDCHWECDYRNGELIGKRWVTDPTGRFNCCPASTRQCLNDCDGHTKHCPPCFFCYYTCAHVGNGVLMWKKIVDTSPNKLACCKPGLTPKSGKCGRLGAIY